MPKCVGGITWSKQVYAQSQFSEFETKCHLILPSSGQLMTPDTRIIHFYRNEKFKANRASETDEQRKERLRIRHEKDRARRRTKKLQEEKKMVVRNRRPRETAPSHSQNIEAR